MSSVGARTSPVRALMRDIARRSGAGAAALLLAAGCAGERPAAGSETAPPIPATIASLTWLGTTTIERTPSGVLQHFGGISGLDYDRATGTWYLLSDDKSEFAPARFYTARLGIDATGFSSVVVEQAIALRQADGSTYPDPAHGGDVPDPEAMRIDPRNGELVWSSEGDRRIGLNPWVRRADRAGRFLGEWRLPANLAVHRDEPRGARHNLSLEGLAFTPEGDALWMAMEAPLYEDGPLPTMGRGAWVRFTRVGRDGAVRGQYAYPVDAIPRGGSGGSRRSDNGVSEVLAIGRHALLVVERSGHEVGEGLFEFSVRLYQAEWQCATDIAGLPSLAGAAHVPIAKRLLLDLGLSLPGHIDNLEAAAWGPRLPDGRLTLVLASDDNFAPNQVNQLIVFAVNER